MTLKEALDQFIFKAIVYEGAALDFGKKNKDFPEWFKKYKNVKGKVGLYTEPFIVISIPYLAFFIDDGELDN